MLKTLTNITAFTFHHKVKLSDWKIQIKTAQNRKWRMRKPLVSLIQRPRPVPSVQFSYSLRCHAMRSSRAWRSKIYCRKGRLKDKAPSDLPKVEEKDASPRFYSFRSLVVLNCCTSDIFWRQASLVFSHSTAFEGSIVSQATRLLVSRGKHDADWTPYIILSDNALMIIIFVRLESWDNDGKLNYYFVCGGNKLWCSGRE